MQNPKSVFRLLICLSLSLPALASSPSGNPLKAHSNIGQKTKKKASVKPRQTCNNIQWSDRDLAQTFSCIEETSKKCLETSVEVTCRRAMALKDMYLQLLEDPDLLLGKFWRQESHCKAYIDFKEVLEVPIFRERNIGQDWNLRMSRICGLKTPLAESVHRLCKNQATPDDISELKRRVPLIESASGKGSVCYKPVENVSAQLIDTYCSAGFNKTCWTVLLPTIDQSKPVSTYEAKVKEICHKDRNGLCNESEAVKTFEEIYSKKLKADAALAAETRKLIAEFSSSKGQAITLNFETDSKAYDQMISKVIKINEVIYQHARSEKRHGVIPELFSLPLYRERVRVPVISCEAPGTSEVPSKQQAMMVRVLSYSCSPHNRFRLSLTGDPDLLGSRLRSLPDPGPNENWIEGTVVGFRGTGVVTELIVAID